ncbi:beta-hexosaminidase [Paracoccus sp. S-4012]|uniref:glycoside hydrolase family 3 N-terminal domain-containing protein n=1 Tax=Paracoccus sp. S-4012 TaxID=2665648 RepID=UPI0012B0264B|nr:glycoside hydrolase family 3 N-terminal domain-containing protein [Paracoccus sp. S-4012]MRX50807.1 beta-hexosaminidase [Paracoccus sp. S-4012]
MPAGATILGGIAGPVLTPDERAFFREADPWGFILFGRNVADPDQLRRLTAGLREAVGRDAVVMVDQEGGRVQRLRGPHWTDWTPPLTAAAAGPRATFLRYRLIGAELAAVGIDGNCAPTLDLRGETTHPFLRDRCFGSDVASVAAHGRACAEGLLASGVLPVMKHMPGHGRANADTHLNLPVVEAALQELEATDFAPFRALANLPIGMTAHIVFTALDPVRPATQSPAAIRAIRERIGFDGLLTTDDITMEALPGTHAERAAAAIAAGCDVVMHCNGDIAAMAPVAEAAGRLTAAAEARAVRALAARHAPEAADLAALRAEYASLTA